MIEGGEGEETSEVNEASPLLRYVTREVPEACYLVCWWDRTARKGKISVFTVTSKPLHVYLTADKV